MLEAIEGRLGETNLVCDNGDEITAKALFYPEFEHVKRYRFVQERPGEAEMLLQLWEDAPAGLVDTIVSRYQEYVGRGLVVSARVVSELPPTASGKHRLLDQRIPVIRPKPLQ